MCCRESERAVDDLSSCLAPNVNGLRGKLVTTARIIARSGKLRNEDCAARYARLDDDDDDDGEKERIRMKDGLDNSQAAVERRRETSRDVRVGVRDFHSE